MKQKTALITGITGQNAAYLAEFFLRRNYIVYGIRRSTSSFNTYRIDHLYKDSHQPVAQLFVHHGDMTDTSSLVHIIAQFRINHAYLDLTQIGELKRIRSKVGSGLRGINGPTLEMEF